MAGAISFLPTIGAPNPNKLFRPEAGTNLDQIKLMYEESGAFIFGRRTYDITSGWGPSPGIIAASR
jgi:hypothetical protein